MDIDKESLELLKAIPKDVWLQLYNDAPRGALRQMGKLGEDLAKTLRLVTFPLQCTAYIQDRIDAGFAKALSEVPVENRIPPPESLLLEVAEKLKYHPNDSLISDLYVNLLSSSMDKEKQKVAHPAFIHLIGQISSDEAFFLKRLSDNHPSTYIRPKKGWDILTDADRNKEFKNASFIINGKEVMFSDITINPQEFYFPENFYIYIDHLNELGLLEYTNDYINESPEKWRELRSGEYEFFHIQLSKFGWMFYECCTKSLSNSNKSSS